MKNKETLELVTNAAKSKIGLLKESKIQQCHSRTSERHRRKGFYSQVNNTHNKHLIHENKWVSPSTGIII